MDEKNSPPALDEERRPVKTYRVTYLPVNITAEVDPEDLPYGRDGEPGSILDIALEHGVDVDHACGGVCACATCHVIVREGFETCGEASEDEEDQLDNAPGLEEFSRLGCQCVPDGTRDIVVEIPDWNRNMVREAPH